MALSKDQKLKLALEFYKSQSGKCYWCNHQLIPPDFQPKKINETLIFPFPEGWEFPVLDHIIPKSKGGEDSKSNLVLACVSCNTKKASKIWIRKGEQILELKDKTLPFQRRQRNVAHLWADKRVLRYLRKRYKASEYRNLRNVYLALCEIESDFIEELREGREGIQGFNKTLQTYSGLKYDTTNKYLKILKEEGAVEVEQIKDESGNFTDRSRVLLYAFPFTEKIGERIESDYKNTKVVIIDKNPDGGIVEAKASTANVSFPEPQSSGKTEKFPDSRVPKTIKFFIEACSEIKGFKPQVSWAAEGAMLKRYLEEYSEEDLTEELD